jgi:hypothetical protein
MKSWSAIADRRAAEADRAGDQREDGALDAHRLFQPVDREGRVHVPPGVARVADLLGGVVHVGGGCELADDAMDFRARRRDEATGLPPEEGEVVGDVIEGEGE